MSRGSNLESGNQGNKQIQAALLLTGFVALIGALIVARSVPPEFDKLASPLVTISSNHNRGHSLHDQRPRFDNNGFQWITPVSNFHQVSSDAESAHLATVVLLPYSQQTKGFHYNRPPPAI
jgi:hypothetical protein